MDSILLGDACLRVVEDIHHGLAVFGNQHTLEPGETVRELRLVGGAVEGDCLALHTAAQQMALTLPQQIAQPFVLQTDVVQRVAALFLQQVPLLVILPVACDIEGSDKVIDDIALGIEQGLYVTLDILVDLVVGILHVLAEQHILTGSLRIDTAEDGHVEHIDGLPEPLDVPVIVHAAECLHAIIGLGEEAVLVIERDGHKGNVGQCLVFMHQVAGSLVLLHLLRHVVDGIDDIGRVPITVQFRDGMTVEVEPFRLV